jgi:hypothetical protein
MEIGPISPLTTGSAAAVSGAADNMVQLVAAVHGLNRRRFMERGQQMRVRRTGYKSAVVELFDGESGEILDELPPEAVLRMMTELEKEREEEE